jgi:SpoVK/Ycf46/Vps4 family AAA+-type ATPase
MKRRCNSDGENDRPHKKTRNDNPPQISLKRRCNSDGENDRPHKKPRNDNPPQIPPIQIIRLIPIMPPQPNNEHSESEDDPIEIESELEDFYNDDSYDEIIDKEITSIDDLIELGLRYNPYDYKKYNINLRRLNDLIEPLKELKNMIGMEKVKTHILDMILYYLQDFEKRNKNMMHTVLYGPPGCGKTELAHILAKLYCKMGVIKTDIVHIARRSDLIGKYLGHTAKNTQAFFDKAKGGVALLDEVYALGSAELKDSFSKECIDTINQNLTENKGNFICIIAGYKDAIEKCFFAYNQGLERRFPFRFTIDEYSAKNIREIFLKKVNEENWTIANIEDDVPVSFFEKNRQIFKFNGGDMETLFHMVRIVHARRVFCLPKDKKKSITYIDMERALKMFVNDDSIKNRTDDKFDHSKLMMYI